MPLATDEGLVPVVIEIIDGMRPARQQRIAIEHVDETAAALGPAWRDKELALFRVPVEAAAIVGHDVAGGAHANDRVAAILQVRWTVAVEVPAIALGVPGATEVIPEADVEARIIIHLVIGELRLAAVGNECGEEQAVVEG